MKVAPVKKASVAILAIPVATSMLLLAGCSGDSKPDASRSSTASPSPTTTEVPTTSAPPTTTRPANVAPKPDPGIPAAARLPGNAGALAFTKYFVKRWNAAMTGPRTGSLAPLCHPSSQACAIYDVKAAKLAKAGLRYDGDPVSIDSIAIQDGTNGRMVDILGHMVQEGRSVVDASGKVIRTDKKKDFGDRFVVLYTGKTWSMSFIQSSQPAGDSSPRG